MAIVINATESQKIIDQLAGLRHRLGKYAAPLHQSPATLEEVTELAEVLNSVLVRLDHLEQFLENNQFFNQRS